MRGGRSDTGNDALHATKSEVGCDAVIEHDQIELARGNDAQAIAELSRGAIEYGLPWRWTPARVLLSIRDRETNVLVARDGQTLAGFGIMKYREDDAHLLLLAVDPTRQRRGLGSTLVSWLERTAIVAGITFIRVEARDGNLPARSLYDRLGFRETGLIKGYYLGAEHAVCFEKRLR
jgi:[ribosomal protein S18]-alanine N-acetyltransferase